MPHAYTRAFLYENGATTYISVDGKRDTHVLDLNNSGMVLGTASNGFEAYDYFLYFQGETILLKDILAAEGYAGWSIDGAIGLNDNDQLIVHALNNATGEARELLLSTAALPVPEPGTWAMLLAGLGCVGMLKRRARAA
ncbi:PEPxxWA-CTERM sorting domain-containing protein [Pseudoduganella flava]|uniref:PEPxxWA-CTERM sorting domain-containing protein n=2 Tax=Pseudoduganella flava TaxID=871742 RepID=A0ABX6G1Q1_9BURK|nr:PEPxxWA-CTERM sorting domain-containing protein [Pseudoduganella flava]